MHGNEVNLSDLVKTEEEHQVTDRLDDSIVTAFEQTSIDAIQLETDSVTSHKK